MASPAPSELSTDGYVVEEALAYVQDALDAVVEWDEDLGQPFPVLPGQVR
jgi:hypothetical protein